LKKTGKRGGKGEKGGWKWETGFTKKRGGSKAEMCESSNQTGCVIIRIRARGKKNRGRTQKLDDENRARRNQSNKEEGGEKPAKLEVRSSTFSGQNGTTKMVIFCGKKAGATFSKSTNKKRIGRK